MNKNLLLLMTLPALLQADLFRFAAEVGAGYRCDSFEVDKKIDHAFFPVYSQAKWKNLNIAEGVLNISVDMPYNFYFLAVGRYGGVFKGSYGVKETFLDEGSLVSFETNSNHVSGTVYDVRGALGMRFYSCCNSLVLTPLVGYAYYHNNYRSDQGKWGPIDTDLIEQFPFSAKLSNDYSGLWIGFEARYMLNCNLGIYGAAHYDWMHFTSNSSDSYLFKIMSDTAVSHVRNFKDSGNCRGPVVQAGIDYLLGCNFYIGTQFEYRYINSQKANEQYYDNETITTFGGSFTVKDNKNFPVEHIKWRSWVIDLHLGWYY